ncbi:M23 family metallopeptidase [Pseudaquidulcibacter saccharophilus]|uniref:M23 family metallopeptidase n=1 Tax=Pseudaquidulcibacter saccharophilus TaxID=2831900 RepID=UPI001EFF223B|nr:M23 family metallopeptidase [Pseudaquidulcibacter saccharophilus]
MSKICRMRDGRMPMISVTSTDAVKTLSKGGKPLADLQYGSYQLVKRSNSSVWQSGWLYAGMVALCAAMSPLANNIAHAQSASQSYASGNNEVERRTISVNGNEGIGGALNRIGANSSDVRLAVRALGKVVNTDDVKRDDQLTVFMRNDSGTKRLLGFNLASGADRSITVTRTIDGDYKARELTTKMQKRSLRVAGVIGENGLLASVREQGAPDRVADSLADAFAYDVDFQREIGPGSSFELMFDRVSDSRGAVVREGEPTYARITTLSGRSIELYRFQASGESSSEWYDENGRSARKFLMRTPINGARLTSNFGYRVHPISGYTKLHEGVDFGAPTGTPVYSAGDGVVTRAGIMGGYGNVVDIDHGNGWSTRYGHLSRFASGLSVGDRVKQGQTIALSGNTGRSTGPHLHFEIRKNGSPLNPMSAQVPNGKTLAGTDYRNFQAQVSRVDNLRRSAMNGVNVANSGISVRAAN